ncbi:MAG TPA: cytoplasmic protein [Bacillus sp. (in: firmicutes)]|uniref:S4 domain-containing protein n=1 Tax=Bacillus litorisediminis TaxID=2922713 RepID=UPI001FABB08C|nr:cytoplasmic protein [Bacillus litorisediminis]HWO74549.1 cytoplasmic protein [Bacillus sp. (in: firmicutes)]
MQIATKELVWNLVNVKEDNVVHRHCSNCGKVVPFFDTNVRRHNANGKTIYRFAIFKCEKNHTWNKRLEIYKTYTDHVRLMEERVTIELEKIELSLEEFKKEGIQLVCIKIGKVLGTFRLDKTISDRFTDWSRSEIVSKIKEGSIRVNGNVEKPSSKISENSILTISL